MDVSGMVGVDLKKPVRADLILWQWKGDKNFSRCFKDANTISLHDMITSEKKEELVDDFTMA